MKKSLLSLMFIVFLALATIGQTEYVPLTQVRNVADQKAQSLWGSVYSSEPLAYYSKNDELIGYRFTYSVNNPFPEKALLLQKCKEGFTQGNHKAQWGIDEYGTIFVSARKDIAVIQDYSKALSPEYAVGLMMEEKAKEKIGGTIAIKKAYYIDFQNQWFCYTNGTEDIYVVAFPAIKAVSKDEFHQIVDSKSFFCARGDYSAEWAQYLGGQFDSPAAQVWIPNHDGNCRFYDWSYGCSPTAAAMLLSYWDYVSSISASNYSKLVDYYFQRWDGIEGETDYQVPNTNKELAIAMNTDTILEGGTDRIDIAPGYATVCNNYNGYNFTCTDHDHGSDYVWYFNKIASEIGTYGRPIHISIPGHSECCVAYEIATNLIGVHNTWWEGVQWISRSQVERVYTIEPGGATGYAIELTYPLGDVGYNHNGNGETLYAGDVYEINWSADYATGSYVKISYSANGGYNWTPITTNTPNDGNYDWVVPAGVNSSACRILVYIYNSSNVFSGGDASLGNFKIYLGGSISTLTEDVVVTTSAEPDYYKFTQSDYYWAAVGVRPTLTADDWDIYLYEDLTFSNTLASSTYGGSNVDFVVIDANHSPLSTRGIKAKRYDGTSTAKVEFEGGADVVYVGTPLPTSWTAGDVVEMYDVNLQPGYYKVTLDLTSGAANLGMALYGSSDAPYYAGRSAYLASADYYGAGADESFFINITTADWYGLCLWANDANSANFTIKAELTGQWIGGISNDWHTAGNWSGSYIPTATTDVVINSGYTYFPIISSAVANCNNITIGSGANLRVFTDALNVAGDMTVNGQLEMTNSSGSIYIAGSIFWESGSTANYTAAGSMYVYGDWEFRSGANAQLANGYVFFTGALTSYIRSYESNCAFRNVLNNKTDGYLYFSSSSTDTLKINGYYDNLSATSLFYFNTTHPLVLKGQLYNYGHIYCPYGTFIFDGTSHTIDLNTGDYFNDIIFSSTGNVTLADTLRVNGNLTINSGTLVAGSYPIFIKGNWVNNVGTGGFNEGAGKVVFNGGNYHQYCSNETFNMLEVDKSLGGAFRINGTNVTCAGYDWTAGAVDVLSGSFTANDLVDNGIFGSYYLNAGGTINLYNPNGWVDLDGYLYIYGGNFNVYGGNGSDSNWPYSSNGGLTMSGGTLDFKNVGVYVDNTITYTFTENITNGTIKTSRGFGVYRSDFTPSGGTIEFYGPTDGLFYTFNGGYVKNVIINKSVVDNSETISKAIIRDRESSTVTDAPLANTVTVFTSADIKGNVTIQSGILSAGATTINVAGDWNNMVGTTGFLEGTSTVVFDGALAADVLSAETFFNLNLNKTYSLYDGLELFNDIAVANDLHILDGCLELNDPSNLYVTGNVTIDLNAGLNANDLYGAVVSVGKNWTNANTSHTTEFGFDPGYYSTVTFNGTTDQYLSTACFQEDFYNFTIDKSAGKFRSNANTQSYGNVLLQQGNWEDNATGLTHSVWHNFTVTAAGVFYNAIPKNTVEFKGSPNSILTYSGVGGYFHNLIINKTTGYSVTQVGNTSCQFDGSLTIDEGMFDQNGYQLYVFGDVNINDAGKLKLPAGSLLGLSDLNSLNVNSGGTMEIAGSSITPVLIQANTGTARYNFNVNSGGTIAADYCVFKNMTANGVNVKSGATVDPAHTFKGCTFQDGAAGGSLLTINNDQVMTIRNAVFPSNTWGGNWNVSKVGNAGYVYFVDYSGGFSGEAYDNDYWERIIWVMPLTATATASPSTICSGTTSQLNVNRLGGLGSFTYIWSPSSGLSNPGIINPVANPLTTTTYYVTVTDALGTTATSSILLTVNPILPVGVSITASANPVPPATYVTLTATPVNGGAYPSYQWKVNGVNVGTGLPTYSYIPSNNDHVTCVLTSIYYCVSGNPATSNIITMMIVAANTSVTGNVPSPLSLCFDAINTITVAGTGSTFVVESGGSAIMIAGVKILYLPGTTVQPNGYMHGYITTTNDYCGSPLPAFVAVATGEQEQPLQFATSGFSIYPNPTTGRFTLIQKGDNSDGIVRVEIFGMRGETLRSEILINERKHEFNISDLSVGLYFVKVVKNDYVETFKLVVTR